MKSKVQSLKSKVIQALGLLALWTFAFGPWTVRAQCILTADGLAAFSGTNAAGGGGGGGGSQYALVRHATASHSGTGNAVTTAADFTGCNLFVIVVGFYQGTATASDSKGNTWTGLTTYNDASGNYHEKIFYVISPTTDAAQTFTVNAGYIRFDVYGFSVSGRTPILDSSTGYTHPSGQNNTTWQPGSITPAGNNELFVTGAFWNNSATVTIDSSFIGSAGGAPDQGRENSDSGWHGAAFLAQTTGSAKNPTWTASANQSALACAMAVFK